MAWLSSHKRKRHQRAVNKYVRQVNKQIEDDELWRGRFVVKQIKSQFYHYEDGSGATLGIHFRFYDKKTGIIEDWFETSSVINMWHGSRLFWKMNKFITEYCDAWSKEDPRLDTKNYREVKI
jgi:hypothetical protein